MNHIQQDYEECTCLYDNHSVYFDPNCPVHSTINHSIQFKFMPTVNKINHVLLNSVKGTPEFKELLLLIELNNEGKTKLVPEDLMSYATCKSALYPTCKLVVELTPDDYEKGLKTARVSEDGGQTWAMVFNQKDESN